MAITTLDGVIAGFVPPVPFFKLGGTMASVSARRAYTPWYASGNPGPSTGTTVGVDGEAVTPSLSSVEGRIHRTNPTGSNLAYVGRLTANASVAGTLWLIDRLWQNSGLSVTSTAAQPITPAALPPRDADGTTNGRDVFAAIEWRTAGGAGTPTVTLTYTDQNGNTGVTATVSAVTTPPVGTFELFYPQEGGNTGVRAPTSFIQSATRTSGAMHLVLFRVLAQVEVPSANIGNAIDALTGGMPRVYNDSVLQLVWFPTTTTGTGIFGQYIETQG